MDKLERAQHGRRGAGPPEEVTDAELVEAVQVGGAERVRRVDGRNDLLEGRLDGVV